MTKGNGYYPSDEREKLLAKNFGGSKLTKEERQ